MTQLGATPRPEERGGTWTNEGTSGQQPRSQDGAGRPSGAGDVPNPSGLTGCLPDRQATPLDPWGSPVARWGLELPMANKKRGPLHPDLSREETRVRPPEEDEAELPPEEPSWDPQRDETMMHPNSAPV